MSFCRVYAALCSLACFLALSVGGTAVAADAVPPPPDLSKLPAPPPAAPAASSADITDPASPTELTAPAGHATDPSVQETVVEDDNARIDELKVRGRSKRIVVKPKIGPAYEIIPPGSGPNISQGARGTNGAVGKRVWPVLSF